MLITNGAEIVSLCKLAYVTSWVPTEDPNLPGQSQRRLLSVVWRPPRHHVCLPGPTRWVCATAEEPGSFIRDSRCGCPCSEGDSSVCCRLFTVQISWKDPGVEQWLGLCLRDVRSSEDPRRIALQHQVTWQPLRHWSRAQQGHEKSTSTQ